MVNFVSPGVYVIEKDISDYTPSINPTVVGIVGFATKGPGNKPTLITSAENLKKTFGEPQETLAGQGLEGALCSCGGHCHISRCKHRRSNGVCSCNWRFGWSVWCY